MFLSERWVDALFVLASDRMGGGGSAPNSQATSAMIMLAGVMFVLVFIAFIVVLIVKKKPGLARDADPLSPENAIATLPNIPELKAAQVGKITGALDRYRQLVTVENRGRYEACRVAKELYGDRPIPLNEEEPEKPGGPHIWILSGPGALGASAINAARHLDSLNFRVTIQQVQFVDKLSEEAQMQRKIIQTMKRVRWVESPHPQPLDGVAMVLAAAEVERLAEARRKGVTEIIKRAGEQNIPVEQWEEFNAYFTPPPPDKGDVLVPVPEDAVSREDARVLDSLAIDIFKIPGGALMENAGYGAARIAFQMAREIVKEKGKTTPKIAVVCGRGNNGGDGLVVARHLRNWGYESRVFLLGLKNRVTDDVRKNLVLLEKDGLKVIPLFDFTQWPQVEDALDGVDLIVDAMLGTGMIGPVRGWPADMIPKLNACREKGAKILALDCPSGLDCNTGQMLGLCIQADQTVTFGAKKIGFGLEQGPQLCGEVTVVDIGLPRELYFRRNLLAAQASKIKWDEEPSTESESESEAAQDQEADGSEEGAQPA